MLIVFKFLLIFFDFKLHSQMRDTFQLIAIIHNFTLEF